MKFVKVKAPANLKGVIKEVSPEAVPEWVAAGWTDISTKKPKVEPKAQINSPTTDENKNIGDNK